MPIRLGAPITKPCPQVQTVPQIGMRSTAVDMLVAYTVLDDVDDRHAVSPTQPVILAWPIENNASPC